MKILPESEELSFRNRIKNYNNLTQEELIRLIDNVSDGYEKYELTCSLFEDFTIKCFEFERWKGMHQSIVYPMINSKLKDINKNNLPLPIMSEPLNVAVPKAMRIIKEWEMMKNDNNNIIRR